MYYNEIPDDFKAKLAEVKNKRARYVIDTIMEKGVCTTEDLQNAGYEHAPRAARDVRELGIPLVTSRVPGSDGKSIAAYSFGDWDEARRQNKITRYAGRTQLTAKLKAALIERYGERCNLYNEECSARMLQVDHRIPYEIAGDQDIDDPDNFQLLCPSANREKSWSCEHCENWDRRDVEMCACCYYASPEDYSHIAGRDERRIVISFPERDKLTYGMIKIRARHEGQTPSQYCYKVIFDHVNK